MNIHKNADHTWTIERDNGERITLTMNESTLLRHLMHRDNVWSENIVGKVEEWMCGQPESTKEMVMAELERSREDIIDEFCDNELRTDDEVSDIVEDALDNCLMINWRSFCDIYSLDIPSFL